MSLLRNITSGLRSLFRKEQVDRELNEELGAYLEMEVAEKMKQGMSRKDALRAVRLEHGGLELAKEVVRSAGWESFVETCWQDLRFAARDRKSTRLNSSHGYISYAVFCLKKKKQNESILVQTILHPYPPLLHTTHVACFPVHYNISHRLLSLPDDLTVPCFPLRCSILTFL